MNPTASLYLLNLSKTLQDEILPSLTDAHARAAASSMLQILAYLEHSTAWSPKPLTARLAARLNSSVGFLVPTARLERFGDLSLLSAEELEQAIEACDAHIQAIIDTSGPSSETLTYCCEAARVDLQFMRPSNLGKLTRK
ncbi:hypothetical protein [Bradyrhizobium liaoningense]